MSQSGSANTFAFDVRDIALAESGKRRIEWAFQSMCVLQDIRKHLIKTQPFASTRISACLPVTPETANLLVTLRDGGATIVLSGARGLCVDDGVAASLVKDYCLSVFAWSEVGRSQYASHLEATLEHRPHLLIDSSGDLFNRALEKNESEASVGEIAGSITDCRSVSKARRLRFPVISTYQSAIREKFQARYGAAQTVLDLVLESFHLLMAGQKVVVSGFGGAGRGIAARAKGLGASVIVTEIDPVTALEAVMEGYRVLSMAEASTLGDLFITVSGNRSVIGREHFDKLRNGAILCNAGRSDVEIDLPTLRQLAGARRQIREGVEEISMRDGRRIYLVAEGRSLQSNAGEAQPSSVLDLSFATQALSAEYLIKQRSSLENKVHPVPREIDRQVARLKLETMGVKIDRMTVEQEQYLASWSEDT